MLKGWTTGRLLSWLKWSEGRLKNFVAQRYEPLLRFSSTPVYDVTLAEDITNVKISSPYIIPLNSADNIQKILMLILLPAVAAVDFFRVDCVFDNDFSKITKTNFSSGTTLRQAVIEAENDSGIAQSWSATGGATGTSAPRSIFIQGGGYSPVFVTPSSKITEVQIYGASGGAATYTLKAGTRITIYAAKEAE